MPALTCFLSALIVLTGVVAPVLEYMNLYELSTVLYRTLGAICHQLPTRCIWILGRPMGICSRDMGIYLGIFILSLVVLKQKRIPDKKLALLILPLMLDVSAKLVGWHSNRPIAFLTGLGGGIGFMAIVIRIVAEIKGWYRPILDNKNSSTFQV